MSSPYRLLTAGTAVEAVNATGWTVSPENPQEDAATIMRNDQGYFAVGSDLWTGYYETERMTRLAVALLRATILSDTIERKGPGLPRPSPRLGPHERVEV